MTATTFREKLPSALAAIALQVGMLALLALSFEVVRQIGEGKETILTLPPLARPVPAAKPAVRNGRTSPAPSVALPAPTQPLPAWASEGFALGGGPNGLLLAPRAGLDCRSENFLFLSPAARQACASSQQAQRDPNALTLLPDRPMANAPTFQAEIDRRNAPLALPGASGGWVSLLFTLLANPGAFSDRRNYTYAQPQTPTMDGAEMTRQFAMHTSDCPTTVMDDTSRKACNANLAAVPMFALAGGASGGGGPHASDAAFQDALAAAQARRSLYGRPVLASGAQPGGGHEKDGGSGGAGAAVGGAGTNAGPGR